MNNMGYIGHMKVNELDQITGTLSKPSKMPGWAYGIPAKNAK
jgi:hypothetical protein